MGKGKGRQDPFGTYVEWAEHRYDPGHYLGGTIAPHLRKSTLGPRARRLSGIMLVVSGLCSALSFLVLTGGAASSEYPRTLSYLALILEIAVSLLLIVAGAVLYRSPKPRRG
jgi:hypothetical protein